MLQSIAAMVRDLAIDPALLFAEKPELSPLPEITLPGQWIPATSTQVLAYIRLLYDVEVEAKELSAPLRRDPRQEKSVPRLEQFRAWLES